MRTKLLNAQPRRSRVVSFEGPPFRGVGRES